MERIEFKNKIFEYSLIGYIIILLSWNTYALTTGNSKALISITIEGILMLLILLKNKHAKIAIKIWAIIIILSHGISFLAKFVKIMLGDEIVIYVLINQIIFLLIGILIYTLNEKYVEITTTE